MAAHDRREERARGERGEERGERLAHEGLAGRVELEGEPAEGDGAPEQPARGAGRVRRADGPAVREQEQEGDEHDDERRAEAGPGGPGAG